MAGGMSVADSRLESDGRRELRGVLPKGTRLRSYELRSVLDQGSFGITYSARDLQLYRDVAIKVYLPVTGAPTSLIHIPVEAASQGE
jgi:serine/threonine protein kinase